MKILVISMLALVALQTQAQSKHRFALYGSPLLGKSMNYYTNTPYVKLKQPYKLGFGLGLVYDYGFHNNFGLRTGFEYNYTRRQIRTENTNDLIIITTTSAQERTIYLNSVQIPINIYYKLNSDFGNFKLLFGFGYQIHLSGKFKDMFQTTRTSNILLNQTNVTTSTNEGVILFQKAPDNTDANALYHKRGNLCINMGLAYEYKEYMIEFKYMYGVGNQYALPQNPNNNVVTDRYSTSTFGLSLGYFIK